MCPVLLLAELGKGMHVPLSSATRAFLVEFLSPGGISVWQPSQSIFYCNGHTNSFSSAQPCRRGAHRSDGLQEALTPQSKRHVYAGREYFNSQRRARPGQGQWEHPTPKAKEPTAE